MAPEAAEEDLPCLDPGLARSIGAGSFSSAAIAGLGPPGLMRC